MNIDNLTYSELKQIAAMFQPQTRAQTRAQSDTHWEIGRVYLIRTVLCSSARTNDTGGSQLGVIEELLFVYVSPSMGLILSTALVPGALYIFTQRSGVTSHSCYEGF